MADTREPRSVVDAAEQAAAAGDYASAERLLREAALLQEARLGPLHPDLANTLNNLGVVCEITDKPVDAEQYFRRAYAIATAVLEPDHQFVATSRKNLEEFCTARGKAVDPPSAPSIADSRHAPATGSDLPPGRLSYEESRPVAPMRSSRPLAIGALIAAGLILAFIATTWFRSNDEGESSPRSPSVSPGSAATTAVPSPVRPSAPDAPKEIRADRSGPPSVGPKTGVTSSTTPTGGRVGESPALPTAAAKSRTAAASAPQPPLVASAQLCRDLSTGGPPGSSSDWQCVAPGSPVDPGRLFFYTRVKSPTDTTVQHRWYRSDRLRQTVELPIRANPSSGYRTYSRSTVDGQDAGDWRVELTARDGTLLHEERFVVR